MITDGNSDLGYFVHIVFNKNLYKMYLNLQSD
jgi:hypothetical protein